MTEFVDFDDLSAANEARNQFEEYVCPIDDDERMTEVGFKSDTPAAVMDMIEAQAAEARGESIGSVVAEPLDQDTRDKISSLGGFDGNVSVQNWRSAKGVFEREGIDNRFSEHLSEMAGDFDDPIEGAEAITDRLKRDGERTGTRDMGNESVKNQQREADAATRVLDEQCDHARDHCKHGEPEACEHLKEVCGFDDDEVAELLGEPETEESDNDADRGEPVPLEFDAIPTPEERLSSRPSIMADTRPESEINPDGGMAVPIDDRPVETVEGIDPTLDANQNTESRRETPAPGQLRLGDATPDDEVIAERIRDGDDNPFVDPDADLTDKQLGALSRSVTGYLGAVSDMVDALETAREAMMNAQKAAKAIDGIRAEAGQPPTHFRNLEEANAELLDLARVSAQKCHECHADHHDHDHEVTDDELEDVREFVAEGAVETPVGISEETEEHVAEHSDVRIDPAAVPDGRLVESTDESRSPPIDAEAVPDDRLVEQEAVDFYVTVQDSEPTRKAIERSEAKVGVEAADSSIPPTAEFVDYPFSDDSMSTEDKVEATTTAVRATQPEVAVAPDVGGDMTLDRAVDVGDRLLDEGASNVVIVPKSVDPAEVPDRFRVGFPAADFGDGMSHTVDDFTDADEVHVLGGSPQDQIDLLSYGLSIASADGSAILRGADQYAVWFPEPPHWRNAATNSDLYDRIETSADNVVKAWDEEMGVDPRVDEFQRMPSIEWEGIDLPMQLAGVPLAEVNDGFAEWQDDDVSAEVYQKYARREKVYNVAVSWPGGREFDTVMTPTRAVEAAESIIRDSPIDTDAEPAGATELADRDDPSSLPVDAEAVPDRRMKSPVVDDRDRKLSMQLLTDGSDNRRGVGLPRAVAQRVLDEFATVSDAENYAAKQAAEADNPRELEEDNRLLDIEQLGPRRFKRLADNSLFHYGEISSLCNSIRRESPSYRVSGEIAVNCDDGTGIYVERDPSGTDDWQVRVEQADGSEEVRREGASYVQAVENAKTVVAEDLGLDDEPDDSDREPPIDPDAVPDERLVEQRGRSLPADPETVPDLTGRTLSDETFEFEPWDVILPVQVGQLEAFPFKQGGSDADPKVRYDETMGKFRYPYSVIVTEYFGDFRIEVKRGTSLIGSESASTNGELLDRLAEVEDDLLSLSPQSKPVTSDRLTDEVLDRSVKTLGDAPEQPRLAGGEIGERGQGEVIEPEPDKNPGGIMSDERAIDDDSIDDPDEETEQMVPDEFQTTDGNQDTL